MLPPKVETSRAGKPWNIRELSSAAQPNSDAYVV